MQKPNGWDTTNANMGGEFERLTAGGHIVKILHAEVGRSQSGKDMLVINFDIAEGSAFDGMFRRQFDVIKRSGSGKSAPRWPNGGTYYQLTTDREGNANPRFKGLIVAIEQSNAGYRWDWDERKLANLKVGLIFREEEYLNQNDELRIAVKAMACCPANEALDKAAPKMKKLDPGQLNATQNTAQGFTQVDDDELPF